MSRDTALWAGREWGRGERDTDRWCHNWLSFTLIHSAPPPLPGKVSCQPGLSFDVKGKGSNLYIVDFDEQLVEEDDTRAGSLLRAEGEGKFNEKGGKFCDNEEWEIFFIADARANYFDMDFHLRFIHQILRIEILEALMGQVKGKRL